MITLSLLILYLCRNSASCTHISGLLHALVAMSPPEIDTAPSAAFDNESSADDLPVTSFTCKWNVPRKRKESSAELDDGSFQKHVYGRERKHTLRSLSDFDPRPTGNQGTAPRLL